jgi:uncharacterized membrane protein YjdF
MFKTFYLIWALLPLFLFLLGLWAIVKPVVGMKGREHTWNYFKQSSFCIVGLLIAVWIDNTESFQELIADYSFWKVDLKVAEWLLYPFVLLLMALAQQYWRNRKGENKRQLPVRRR